MRGRRPENLKFGELELNLEVAEQIPFFAREPSKPLSEKHTVIRPLAAAIAQDSTLEVSAVAYLKYLFRMRNSVATAAPFR